MLPFPAVSPVSAHVVGTQKVFTACSDHHHHHHHAVQPSVSCCTEYLHHVEIFLFVCITSHVPHKLVVDITIFLLCKFGFREIIGPALGHTVINEVVWKTRSG